MERVFQHLLNVKNAGEQLGEVPTLEGPVQEISREEVKKAIDSMKEGAKKSMMLRPPNRSYQTHRGE